MSHQEDLSAATKDQQLTALTQALHACNERLETTTGELESANADLRDANQALLAANDSLTDEVATLTHARNDILDLLDGVAAGVLLLDAELRVRRLNTTLADLAGLRPTDVGRPIAALVGKLGYGDLPGLCAEVQATGRPHSVEARTPDGRWFALHARPYRPVAGDIAGVVLTFTDVSQRKASEVALHRALAEKETLLRELFHRTKNNMQVIQALLDMQAMQVQDPRLERALAETRNRIQSMALAHQKLYESEDLSRINLGDYIADLAAFLMRSYRVAPEKVALHLQTDDVTVLMDTAVPCGLVVNELITNALTHAFPGDRRGDLTVEVHRSGAHDIAIRIADNGVGVPAGFDFRTCDALGLRAVHTIVEQQLLGQVHFTTAPGPGVTCHIRFTDDHYRARI